MTTLYEKCKKKVVNNILKSYEVKKNEIIKLILTIIIKWKIKLIK